mgnify:CR=1 FL=1
MYRLQCACQLSPLLRQPVCRAMATTSAGGKEEEEVLPGMIDWSKVSKDQIKCRELYTAHLNAAITSLVILLAGRKRCARIGLLQKLPPLPIVPEEGGWSEDEYEPESALAALAYERAKEEARLARCVRLGATQPRWLPPHCTHTARAFPATHNMAFQYPMGVAHVLGTPARSPRKRADPCCCVFVVGLVIDRGLLANLHSIPVPRSPLTSQRKRSQTT